MRMIGWGNNSTRTINNEVMELMNPSAVNPWEAQAGYDLQVNWKKVLSIS